MAARHGTRHRYNDGCRCDECKAANAAYQAEYRQRPTAVIPLPTVRNLTAPTFDPVTKSCHLGPVESGVEAEIAGLTEARPGLAQMALALARIMDNPKAVNQQPAAAKVLISMLEKLRSASPAGRRGLAVVREMTKKDGA
jgi:hypothetical protein